MKGTELAAFVRAKTKTNSTTFTDETLVAYANIWLERLAPFMVRENPGALGIVLDSDLVVDQREYVLPVRILGLRKVSAKLDGTNWQNLREFDPETRRIFSGDENGIVARYQGYDPEFLLLRNSITIFSGAAMIDVTDGLKVCALVYPKALTEESLASEDDLSVAPTATTHGIPMAFQETLARGVIIEWKESEARQLSQEEEGLKQIYSPAAGATLLREFNRDKETLIGMNSSNWGQDTGFFPPGSPLAD